MIVISVLSFNGAPSDGRSASFDELGGSIGRADTNQLVLPDPERSISRVHAQVVFRNGGYVLVDRGSNAVLVNGQPVGNGREVPLRDGDTVQIGGYLLGVAMGQRSAAAKDPFADLFGDTLGVPKSHPGTQPAVRRMPDAPVPDPFARPAASPPADLFAPPPSPAPAATPGAGAAAASAIPDDWDPFAPDAPKAARPAPALHDPHAALIPDLPMATPAQESSLDSLFGLGAGGAPSDPLARSALPEKAAANTAGSEDPLQALLNDKPAPPAPVADHVSELNTPWTGAPLQATPAAPAAPKPQPKGAVFSWEQPSREGRVVTQPGVRRAEAPAAPPGVDDPPTMVTPRETPRATPPAPRAAVAPARAATGAAAPDALLAAFHEGLGLPDVPASLGEDEMRLLGRLLRECAQGTVQLLLSRAALKREMRAEVTVIAARENNPLKFSPSAEVALQYLLGPAKPGFLAPEQAMRDAFNDLRAHQLGMMAGMRSALDGVLQRFDPTVLEGQIARRSGLSALLGGNRKAQLWEQFQALYAQLSQEASDDFHQLFGKAFLAAYESYIDQLQSQDD
jgi:type VI secretion system FHA domain protein